MFSYFTISTANEKLPVIIEKFKNVTRFKNEIMKTEQQLSSSLSNTSNFEQYVTLKQKLNSVVTKFYQAIEDLENTGVVIKGIDEGLLDFPSKRFDDEIWLCWKQGETEIKFWHEKDIGFSGRKPISIDDKSLV
ncbi:MAG: DUF2203 domain-containing protein [Nitrososphaerota archaeon]|nr:DUF2203 domain-containing protein [Nitrososphaerota archaeon]MCH8995711.1 DUF2203 domain-containing protein [Nitrososphaerota archaeon]MDG7054744.1 DUF2203 domain-containing protein [Nitrososphaerota archaeon]